MEKKYYSMIVMGYEDKNTGETLYNGVYVIDLERSKSIFDPDTSYRTMVVSDNHKIFIEPFSKQRKQSLLTVSDLRTKQRIQEVLYYNTPYARFKTVKVPISPSKDLVLRGSVVYIDKSNKQEIIKVLNQIGIRADDLISSQVEREKE